MHLVQHVPRAIRIGWGTTLAFAIILAVFAMIAAFAAATDSGMSYDQAPSVQLTAVIDEDVVSPLATTGSLIVNDVSYVTDSGIITPVAAIATYATTTPAGILVTNGLLLLAAIGAIYLAIIGIIHLWRLRGIEAMTTRTLSGSMTFMLSHGGAAYAILTAVLVLAAIIGLGLATVTSVA